jgi:hypothetical protein
MSKKRTPSAYNPDSTIEGVVPQDITDNCLEARHFADNEIDTTKLGTIEDSAGSLIVIKKIITTGSASELIYDSNAPFKFRVVDVIVEPRGTSANGTMKLTDGTNDITNVMTCAVDKTIARAGTIDDAYSTIAAGGSLEVVCAGDAVASTIGMVTVIAEKID